MRSRTLYLVTTRAVLLPTRLQLTTYTLSRRNFADHTKPEQPEQHKSYTKSINVKIRRICGMWYIPKPGDTDLSLVVSTLPQVSSNECRILNDALFLVTPGLAHWFEDPDHFLQRAMTQIYGKMPPPSTEILANKARLARSFVAVVDALPAPEYFTTDSWNFYSESKSWKDSRPLKPAEGMAIFLMNSIHYNASKDIAKQTSKAKGSFSITSRRHDQNAHGLQVPHISTLALPLANTLFVNGRKWTAFQDTWKPIFSKAKENKSNSLHHILLRRSLDSIQISVDHPSDSIFDHHVPLIPLTKARKVVSSMGNIIREVEGDDGSPIRASVELEDVVPKFLKDHVDHDGHVGQAQIQIFASTFAPDGRVNEKTSSDDENQEVKSQFPSQKLFTSIDEKLTHRALWGNGRLHRVMSGGGGWGKKAGLLSLDPATTLDRSVNLDSTGMFPDPDKDELDADTNVVKPAEYGALVPPGHMIQFFAVRVRQPQEPSHAKKSDNELSEYLGKSHNFSQRLLSTDKKLFFGVSTSDEGLRGKLEAPTPDHKRSQPLVLPDCFGILSEGGAALALHHQVSVDKSGRRDDKQQVHGKKVNEFIVDAPSAVFKTSYLKRVGTLPSGN